MRGIELNLEQVHALHAIALARDLERLAQVLNHAFPEVAPRLGDRYTALVARAVQRGAEFGLTHGLAVARYLACWCVLGAEFETKPAFAWAHDILTDNARGEGNKVFQLCLRAKDALAEVNAPDTPSRTASFVQGLAALDQSLSEYGDLGGLLAREPLHLGQACDLDAVDFRINDTPALQVYQTIEGTWQLGPAAVTPRHFSVIAAAAAPGQTPSPTAASDSASASTTLPPQLSLLLPTRGRHPARLRLRTAACCEAHPQVQHNGENGISAWRRHQALDIVLPLQPPPLPTAPSASPSSPGLGVPGTAQRSLLTLSTCGLRSSGRPLGALETQLAVYPADQQLQLWQRAALPATQWSEPGAPQAARSTTAPTCRLERDGQTLDASPWVKSLQALDQQVMEGLNQLFRSWTRDGGVTQAQMTAEPAVLVGNAGLTWGFTAHAEGLTQPPLFRLAGQLDLMACQLNLMLSGTLNLGGARCQVRLRHMQATPLQTRWECPDAQTALAEALQPASCSFSQGFELLLTSLPSRSLAMVCAIGPVQGKLTGSFGLRARADQVGLEWFAKLALEPLSVRLQLSHPLLGSQQLSHPLLPALSLLDWSAR